MPYPQLSQPQKIDWQLYFKDSEKIGAAFCKYVLEYQNPYYTKTHKAYYEKYTKACQKDGGKYKLNIIFTGSDDKNFQQFIYDIFQRPVEQNTFESLAKNSYNVEQLVEFIIDSSNLSQPVKKALKELNKL